MNSKRGAATQTQATAADASAQGRNGAEPMSVALNGETRAKIVLFAVPAADRVDDGPVMRGLLETEQGKVNVAGWKRVARDSGNEYLSLKVGNTKPRNEDAPKDAPDEWLVGPFYGRLFKDMATSGGAKRIRYFGFIEDAEKIGEDSETGKGLYRTNWQVQVRAKPSVSNDGKTHYIDGTVSPAATKAEPGESPLPF